jgi:hypothetical protein
MRGFFVVVLVVAGIFAYSLGGWLIAKGRLPSWAKGFWKWPLGDDLTPAVVRTMGCANLLAGFGCPPAIALVIIWDRSAGGWIAAMTAMFLAGAASSAAVLSVVLSRSKG